MKSPGKWPLDPDALAARFEGSGPVLVGVEEEIMVLHPETLDLLPSGKQLLEGLDDRFKPELPASQVEIATRPHADFGRLAEELVECRRLLSSHLAGRARPAAAGVHPFASRLGALNSGDRYGRLLAEFGDVLKQQLVCGLHVHVSLGGADRVLGVYNALRAYLPELAALAANAPIQCGVDTTLASVRPLICGLLPRQGIPPVLPSWERYAAHLTAGLPGREPGKPAEWWWELRPHGGLGTLEIRVPDAQTHAGDALAVAAVATGVALWLADRFDAGDLPMPAETWMIAENRWSALRHGLDGTLLDLGSGARLPSRQRVVELIETVAPVVDKIGGGDFAERASRLARRNGAHQQRELFAGAGPIALAAWLADSFLPG
ncbi:MAG TPA: YbdK family carboxylate-amine ligase [Actinomycetota bacterium]|nr:YbdK family carboxylate-amine ligase [Actinomycetota bacterium]